MGFGLDIDDLNPTGNGDEDLGFGDLNDIFTDDPFATGGIGGSPGEQGEGQGADMGTGGSGNTNSGQDPAFRLAFPVDLLTQTFINVSLYILNNRRRDFENTVVNTFKNLQKS